MSRLHTLAPENASGKTRELFDGVRSKLGMVPNLMRVMGNSPAVLGAYLEFSGQLSGGSLSAKERELIALAVGQTNRCDYCLAAHSALGKMAGLSDQQITDARRGTAVDSKANALISFVVKLVDQRGHVSDEELDEIRSHGFDDEQIAEVVANVALNIFTNYFNHVADTEVDFPKAAELAAA